MSDEFHAKGVYAGYHNPDLMLMCNSRPQIIMFVMQARSQRLQHKIHIIYRVGVMGIMLTSTRCNVEQWPCADSRRQEGIGWE